MDELPPGFTVVEEEEELPPGFAVEAPSYTDGVATTFGYNDPIDNGMGAWGDPTNNPDIVGVSLPVSVTKAYFGDPNKAHNALVEVVNPATGKTIQAPIVDKGPAEWVIARQGPTIDLTEGARRELGAGGKTFVKYKIIGHEQPKQAAASELPPGFQVEQPDEELPEGFSVDKGHGAEVPMAEVANASATPRPAGPAYLPPDQLKGLTVKMGITDPETGETSEDEMDALEAQNMVKSNIGTYQALMDCLGKS